MSTPITGRCPLALSSVSVRLLPGKSMIVIHEIFSVFQEGMFFHALSYDCLAYQAHPALALDAARCGSAGRDYCWLCRDRSAVDSRSISAQLCPDRAAVYRSCAGGDAA